MASKLKLFFCIAGILSLGFKAESQDSIRCGSWVSANIHYGFIIPLYSNSMTYLLKAHVPAMELDYVKKPDGSLPWQQAFRCPEAGAAFFFAWLGNPAELGNMIGVYPFINFHLQKSYREITYLRLGIGLAYMPVIWNRVTNHKDNVIGSHVNAMVNLRFTTHFYLSDKMRLEAGFGVTHVSDGNYQAPNLGINLLTVNTGLSYCIKSSKCVTPPHTDTVSRNKKNENCIFAATGLSEREPPGQGKYGLASLNYSFYHHFNSKNKLGGGLDLFYDHTNIIRMADDSIHLKSKLEYLQLGLKVNYEVTVGKFSLPYEIGVYLYTKYTGGGSEYNRIGLRYYANKHIIANLTLVAHFATADFIEWGMGYRF